MLLIRRDLPQLSRERPDLSNRVASVMSRAAVQPTRSVSQGIRPLDQDTKLSLVREEQAPAIDTEPVWPKELHDTLQSFVQERAHIDELHRAGVPPTSTMLFVGPPGVGKTLAARWLAREIGWPLLTLDLAAVMSSFLGRTGNNIRAVLDYARSSPAVLLLDEFDSIAKRRDDAADVGELKRLVTVLLQSVDEWPQTGLLIAATNHPELLDPAVWRRFEVVLEFPVLTPEQVSVLLKNLLSGADVSEELTSQFASVFAGHSPAEIVKELNSAKRDAVLGRMPFTEALALRMSYAVGSAPKSRKLDVAKSLQRSGMSQRAIQKLTGISRDTLRAKGIATHDMNMKARRK